MSPPKETAKKSTSTSPVQSNVDAPKVNEPSTKQEEQLKKEPANAEPLAPPPPRATEGPDYFSAKHQILSTESNPFEYSFAGGAAGPLTAGLVTPGGTKLPSVAALTSPALNFWSSATGLRSGPLSPAMLTGPTKDDDYFGDSYLHRGGPQPTQRESDVRSGMTPSERTGLTPGGGGSMFPEPSPGGSAIFNSLANGGATPGTLDFHRTAMNINARKASESAHLAKITSQPQDITMNGMDVKPPQFRQQENETNDAANGLFLLANAHNGPQPTNHYAIAPQSIVHAQNMQMGGQSQETSPHMGHRNGGSISTTSGRGNSVGSEDDQSRPNTRANDQPKAPANKKAKGNNGMSMSMDQPSEDEEPDMSKDEFHANGKKMTDEEKRKNFLERNRVAALKCRQRKKQWLANLQQKVEMYSVENDSLNATVQQLRDELVNLKTILLAHKDCPIAHGQAMGNGTIQQIVEGSYGNPHMNPYGMAINQQHQQQQMMASQGYPSRRES
ncbi:hypothetical protein ONS95_003098 [Cadophora gregata]|uniref:uncharacterized protein n=1 Tax=Cadophora gregata TaxID=51156 RepID=UPI0026DB2560|nr:uncharacterized protein ONS95_003098 [Cadophora gregata]KAK0108282.1 hypothetical protein ONS95_003098 [Cadophora gregata]KAK0109128.1 hypothetical protein ONS96_002954 [Cadophora gregata f. sp. sojae]